MMPAMESLVTSLIGPIAALTAALFWALATLLYSQAGSFLSASQLNLVKGVIACPLLLLAGWFTGQLVALEGNTATYLLLASGVIGITLGDTLYFSALRRLGPWHTMLLEYLAPPFAALLAWILLSQGMRGYEILAAYRHCYGHFLGYLATTNGHCLYQSRPRTNPFSYRTAVAHSDSMVARPSAFSTQYYWRTYCCSRNFTVVWNSIT